MFIDLSHGWNSTTSYPPVIQNAVEIHAYHAFQMVPGSLDPRQLLPGWAREEQGDGLAGLPWDEDDFFGRKFAGEFWGNSECKWWLQYLNTCRCHFLYQSIGCWEMIPVWRSWHAEKWKLVSHHTLGFQWGIQGPELTNTSVPCTTPCHERNLAGWRFRVVILVYASCGWFEHIRAVWVWTRGWKWI